MQPLASVSKPYTRCSTSAASPSVGVSRLSAHIAASCRLAAWTSSTALPQRISRAWLARPRSAWNRSTRAQPSTATHTRIVSISVASVVSPSCPSRLTRRHGRSDSPPGSSPTHRTLTSTSAGASSSGSAHGCDSHGCSCSAVLQGAPHCRTVTTEAAVAFCTATGNSVVAQGSTKRNKAPSEEVMVARRAYGCCACCQHGVVTTHAVGASKAAGKKGSTNEEHSGENAEDQPSAVPVVVPVVVPVMVPVITPVTAEGSACRRCGRSARGQWKGIASPGGSTRLSGVPACRSRSDAAVWLTATKAGVMVTTRVRAKAPGARAMCTL